MIKKILDKIRSWFAKAPVPYYPLQVSNVMPPKPATIIKVYAGDKLIGAVQSLSISEKRSIENNSTTQITVTAHRIRFDKLKVAEAFSQGFVHAASQVNPIQFEIDDDKAVTKIKNSWITAIDESYTTNDWVIVNEANLEAESINSKKK